MPPKKTIGPRTPAPYNTPAVKRKAGYPQRGAGAPTKADHLKNVQRAPVTVTDSLFHWIQQEASVQNLTVAAWVRKILNAARRREVTRKITARGRHLARMGDYPFHEQDLTHLRKKRREQEDEDDGGGFGSK